MIQLACPVCNTQLDLITRHTPSQLTVEQRLYAWLFDLMLDKTATAAEKVKARSIMRKLGLAPKYRASKQPGVRDSTFDELVRLVLSERLEGRPAEFNAQRTTRLVRSRQTAQEGTPAPPTRPR